MYTDIDNKKRETPAAAVTLPAPTVNAGVARKEDAPSSPPSGTARKASALQSSMHHALFEREDPRAAVFTPDIVATLESGTQVLLDDSDAEHPMDQGDDIDDPATPVKSIAHQKPALLVKASFLEDIDEASPTKLLFVETVALAFAGTYFRVSDQSSANQNGRAIARAAGDDKYS